MAGSPGGLDPSRIETPSVPLADLGLAQLRRYRHRLAAEEDRVSYWRRLLHARIDVLRAERRHERPLSLEELVRALGETGAGSRRRALVTVKAAEPLPQLPVLKEIWITDVDPTDPSAVAAALDRLSTAEEQLTAYRQALQSRIDHATAELIDRYRIDPRLALSALPQPPRRPRRALSPPLRTGR
jgi:anti-sigma-K factor RsiG